MLSLAFSSCGRLRIRSLVSFLEPAQHFSTARIWTKMWVKNPINQYSDRSYIYLEGMRGMMISVGEGFGVLGLNGTFMKRCRESQKQKRLVSRDATAFRCLESLFRFAAKNRSNLHPRINKIIFENSSQILKTLLWMFTLTMLHHTKILCSLTQLSSK